MLVSVIEVVKRPHKIVIEVRSNSKDSSFTVSLVSRSSRTLRPVIDKLRSIGYMEDLDRVDRNGYIRIIFHKMKDSDIRVIESVTRKYIGSSFDSTSPYRTSKRKGRALTVTN